MRRRTIGKLSKTVMHYSAVGLGLCVMVLFIISQEVFGAAELENVSKALEWTGMVFLPLLALTSICIQTGRRELQD